VVTNAGGGTPATVAIAVGTVQISGLRSGIEPGDGITLTAIATDLDGVRVPESVINACSDHGWSQCGFQWTSSNQSVATVRSDGTLVAGSPGSTTVSVMVGGVSATETVTVVAAAVASVAVSPATLSMLVGEDNTVSADPRSRTGASLAGRDVSWSSDDDAVSSVNQAGRVRAVGVGDATITATAGGVVGTVRVKVAAAPIDTRTAIEALVVAFGEALQSRDVAVIRRVARELEDEQASAYRNGFRDMEELIVDVSLTSFDDQGETVIAGIHGTFSFVNGTNGRRMELPWDITARFRRAADGWQMRGLRFEGNHPSPE